MLPHHVVICSVVYELGGKDDNAQENARIEDHLEKKACTVMVELEGLHKY